MNTKFKKYNSIENSYRNKFINSIKSLNSFPEMEFQVTEKIHGANYSFIIDNSTDTIFAGKRTGIINENFYGHQGVFDKYSPACLGISKILATKDIDYIQIYGELFGDGVQKGVDYGDKDFCCFDILVVYLDGEQEYLDTTQVEKLCSRFELPHVPVIANNISLNDALDISVDFNTAFNPEIEGNVAEGVVIKPISPAFLASGSRVIIKNKNSNFSEKSRDKVKVVVSLTDVEQEIFDNLMSFTNQNRLNNVVSHIGLISTNDFGKVMKNFSSDVMDDFNKDFSFYDLSKKDIKKITKLWNKEVAYLIRNDWLNLVD